MAVALGRIQRSNSANRSGSLSPVAPCTDVRAKGALEPHELRGRRRLSTSPRLQAPQCAMSDYVARSRGAGVAV